MLSVQYLELYNRLSRCTSSVVGLSTRVRPSLLVPVAAFIIFVFNSQSEAFVFRVLKSADHGLHILHFKGIQGQDLANSATLKAYSQMPD